MTWNAGLYFYALLLLGWGIGLSVGVLRLHHPGPQYPESNELSPIANILLTVSRGTPRVAFVLALAGGILTLVNVFLRVPFALFLLPSWPWWALVAAFWLGAPLCGFMVALVPALIQGERFR